MLGRVCDYVHNYFVGFLRTGEYIIANGAIDLPFLKDGQRFKISGSALNDGIYTYMGGAIYDDDAANEIALKDETFTGSITAMQVPPAFIDVVAEINAWVAKNGAVLDSPYSSESFGGYSYSRAVGSGANAGGVLSWQDKFRDVLAAYRKIA